MIFIFDQQNIIKFDKKGFSRTDFIDLKDY